VKVVVNAIRTHHLKTSLLNLCQTSKGLVNVKVVVVPPKQYIISEMPKIRKAPFHFKHQK
jgi:hypothetical protein